jgi:hypothetical protein
MEIFNFSLMYIAVFASWFFSYKSLKNLTEDGQKRFFKIWFFYIAAEKKYFTTKGLIYRKLSFRMIPIVLLGFIIGVILSS